MTSPGCKVPQTYCYEVQIDDTIGVLLSAYGCSASVCAGAVVPC